MTWDEPTPSTLVPFISEHDPRPSDFIPSCLGEDLFGKLLSYCSCLYLANWVRDQGKEESFTPIFKDDLKNGWWEKVQTVNVQVEAFTSARDTAQQILNAVGAEDQRGPLDDDTLEAAKTFFMSTSQDFRCSNGEAGKKTELAPSCYCYLLRMAEVDRLDADG